MRLVAQRTDAAAAVSLMDLSVEAECFGSAIRVSDREVPTVVGRIVEDEEGANSTAASAALAASGVYLSAPIFRQYSSVTGAPPTMIFTLSRIPTWGRRCSSP